MIRKVKCTTTATNQHRVLNNLLNVSKGGRKTEAVMVMIAMTMVMTMMTIYDDDDDDDDTMTMMMTMMMAVVTNL